MTDRALLIMCLSEKDNKKWHEIKSIKWIEQEKIENKRQKIEEDKMRTKRVSKIE